jgi:hypothetical protein
VRSEPDGRVVFECAAYRLEVAADGRRATLSSPTGDDWATLRPLAALDRTDGVDETLSVDAPRVVGDGVVEVGRRSTAWEEARTSIACAEDRLELRTFVRGRGALADVHLLAGRSLIPGAPSGFLPSSSKFATLFSPSPCEPPRLMRSASETALVSATGDGEPGRGRWFFTPAPLCFALTTAAGVDDVDAPLPEGWLAVGLAAPVAELGFVELAWEAGEGGSCSLRVDYEGHTRVDGDFEAPAVVLTPGLPDPYAGLRAYRDALVARGAAPPPAARAAPDWWSEPIFCGWGAQCHLAAQEGRPPRDLATQASYDRFLGDLERNGVVPRTVVIDDKWQDAYGTNAPDEAKWPDLKAWIAGRHARGQRVLLWWKAWDPEGLPAELCVRNADGAPIAVDPSRPEAAAELRRVVGRLLAPDGLDADGLKVDFTARTPSGAGLSRHGPGWGIALLHRLLEIVYAAAKEAKRDALVITHTPHPAFADVTDMIRLNDMQHGPLGIVAQMRYRAAVVRAACPELPIDTDDWPVPGLATWRDYLAAKPELGIPSLYYSTHLDATGEALTPHDYDALRRTWARWRKERRRRPA